MERVRSRHDGSFTHVYSYERQLDDTIIGTNDTEVGEVTDKVIRDVVTARFRALQKCGKFLPLNGMEVSTITETRVPHTFLCTNHVTTKMDGQFWFQDARQLQLPDLDLDKLQSLVNAAASNAASAQWDVLTFLGELKESVETIHGIAKIFNWRTRELALAAAKVRKNPWKAFQQLWLGYRYGIRPMVHDVQNAVEAISSKEVKFTKGRARSIEEIELSKTTSKDFFGRWFYDSAEFLTGTRALRGIAYAEVNVGTSSRFGLDPLTTAWELIPYSFVVDWFIGVGNYVNTIRPRLMGEYLGIASSVSEEYTWSQIQAMQSFQGTWTGQVDPCSTVIKVKRYQRLPGSVAFPAPKLELSLPHLVDLAALFLKGKADVYKILSRVPHRRYR